MANISTLHDFTTHAAAFQKSTSRAGENIEPQEARTLGRIYGELSDKDKTEARRISRDNPELSRVLQDLDPRMITSGL
jgi:hypothetical protein